MGKISLAVLGLGAALLLLAPAPWLVLRDFEGGERIAAFPLAFGNLFEICYVHSVDRMPVCEVFRLEAEAGIVLQETYFRMFGAGMGHWPGHGAVAEEKGWMKIKEINRPVGAFVLRVGSPGVDHTLAVGKESLNLSNNHAGKRLVVEMQMRSRVFALLP